MEKKCDRNIYKNVVIGIAVYVCLGCVYMANKVAASPLPGIYRADEWKTLLMNKKVGVVANHTSIIEKTHLVDTLLSSQIKVIKIFSPEHGFRGTASAGEKVDHSKDEITGLPIVSLYGANKKPTTTQLEGVDIMVFDLQDVGARFFTYISTLHYVMEACAENNIPLVVLDRPNPNGMYIDGPVLDTTLRSFVGMHPIPVLHGLTVGELAQMINGEKWLKKGLKCALTVVKCLNYTHATPYTLPVKPSPNLPNEKAIKLYASLCLFEGTPISVGRGTLFPFQVIGLPDSTAGNFTFTPIPITDMAKEPMYKHQKCYGIDLRDSSFEGGFTLRYVLHFYKRSKEKNTFFRPFFNTLMGDKKTAEMIKNGYTEAQIKATWQADLAKYKALRKKYILYDD